MYAIDDQCIDTNTGKRIGNYRILRPLGQGGSAKVLLGRHLYLGTQSAIKVPHSELSYDVLRKLRVEARLMAQLKHPHIVAIHDFGMEGLLPYFVMDYAPYGTMRQQYPTHQAIPPSIALEYIKQVASALQYIHNRGVIHQDVKPENMLLLRRDYILLSDFGIALHQRIIDDRKKKAVVGTIAYMAPEQLRGWPCLASDQYALGVVAYEWLYGDVPFRGSSMEIMAQHISAPFPALSDKESQLPLAVQHVLRQALAKEPDQRFKDVQTFAAALERALTERVPYRRTYSTHQYSISTLSHKPEATVYQTIAPKVFTSHTLWCRFLALVKKLL